MNQAWSNSQKSCELANNCPQNTWSCDQVANIPIIELRTTFFGKSIPTLEGYQKNISKKRRRRSWKFIFPLNLSWQLQVFQACTHKEGVRDTNSKWKLEVVQRTPHVVIFPPHNIFRKLSICPGSARELIIIILAGKTCVHLHTISIPSSIVFWYCEDKKIITHIFYFPIPLTSPMPLSCATRGETSCWTRQCFFLCNISGIK